MNQSTSIPFAHKLNGSNYKLWKFQIDAVLRGKGLSKYVKEIVPTGATAEEQETFSTNDGKAMAILIASLESDEAQHVLTCSTAKEIYDTLSAIYAKKSEVSIMTLYEEYFGLKMAEDESMTAYFSKVMKLAAEIEDQGEQLSDNIKMSRIISSLHPRFQNFKTVWFNIKEGRDLNNLLSRLRQEEDQLNKNDGADGAAFATRKKVGNRVSIADQKKTTECHSCGEKGHWQRECPQKQKRSNGEKKSPAAFVASMSDIQNVAAKDVWIVDSGASQHMTSRKEWFSELKEIASGKYVRVASNDKLPIHGHGSIRASMWNGVGWNECVLENVQYVPGLGPNLFSTGTATSRGYVMIERQNDCELRHPDGTVAVIGIKDNLNQYRLGFRLKNEAVANSATVTSLRRWHERLGHLGVSMVKSMVKHNVVDGVSFSDENKFFCGDCAVGKMHRVSHPSANERECQPGERFHADICGPMNVTSVGGYKYLLVFKDEATSFRHVHFLVHKSDVSSKIGDHLAAVEVVTGRRVKSIRTDNGLEFVNEKFKKSLQEKGISHERTSPYTPEQNGRVERENRTIQESARTMLLASGLQLSLWSEAVRAAVYILNRTPNSRSINKTPFEQWFGTKPNLSHLKIFGTEAYVHVPKELGRKKWDAKARKVYLVGYEPTTKNYRLYDSTKKKVIVSCDVTFNEENIAEKLSPEAELTNVNLSDSESEENIQQQQREETTEEDERNESDEGSTTPEVFVEATDDADRYNLRPYIYEPNRYEAGNSAAIEEVSTYEEAIGSKDVVKWKQAMTEELEALEKNETWELVPRPAGRSIVTCKWVYKVKSIPGTDSVKAKARLVARGFTQREGLDYTEVFAPVVRYDTVRIMLCIAAEKDLEIAQFDVKTAFLNGELKEEIFMETPKGLDVNNEKLVCRLKKALYGLKQASRAWNETFTKCLRKFSLVPSVADPCVFYGMVEGHELYLLLYVDDGLVLSKSNKAIDQLLSYMKENFEMTTGNCQYYVGMEIRRDRAKKKISIGQQAYIKKLVLKFNQRDAIPINTPADVNVKLTKNQDENAIIFPYREAVGSLLYAALVSRPDIAFSVGVVSRFLENPGVEQITAVKRILRYLKATSELGIVYESGTSLVGYTDADFAGMETRQSTTGFVFMMGGGPVTWRSQRQKKVTLSTTEAEYAASCEGAREVYWIRQLLKDIKEELQTPTPLFIDNQSTLRLIKNPEVHARTKHFDVQLHFVREANESGTVAVKYVPSNEQLADVFTKPLTRDRFIKNLESLNIVNVYDEWEC